MDKEKVLPLKYDGPLTGTYDDFDRGYGAGLRAGAISQRNADFVILKKWIEIAEGLDSALCDFNPAVETETRSSMYRRAFEAHAAFTEALAQTEGEGG